MLCVLAENGQQNGATHRVEVGTADFHAVGNFGPHLDIDGQSGIQLFAWLGKETVGEFALEHETDAVRRGQCRVGDQLTLRIWVVWGD